MDDKVQQQENLNIFENINSSMAAFLQAAKSLVIDSEPTALTGQKLVKDIRDTEKVLEEMRKNAVKVPREYINKVNEQTKEILAPLIKAKEETTAKIVDYQNYIDAKARKEKLDAMKADNAEPVTENGVNKFSNLIKMPEPKAEPAKLITTRKVWTFEIMDINKLPRKFLCPDTKAISEAIRKGNRKIAGIKIYQKESNIVR